jgi:hypothetical protein
MSKAFVIGFALGLALLGLVGTAASRLTQTQAEKYDAQKYQAEITDATPVRLGVLSPKQQFHSRLHNGVGMRVGGKTISEWLAFYKDQQIFLQTDLLGRRFLESDQLEAPEDFFGRLAMESDAILRGRVTGKISQITEDGCFLFTDYDFVVLDAFKNNPKAPVDTGATVTFTCRGGKIVLDNVILQAGGNGEVLYPINTQDLLLFMRFIPETGSYRLARDDGSFELSGTSVRPFAKVFPLSADVFKDQVSFLKTIRAVSNK